MSLGACAGLAECGSKGTRSGASERKWWYKGQKSTHAGRVGSPKVPSRQPGFSIPFEPSVDFSNQPLPRAKLTFEVVDDLVGAHARGRLNGAPQVRYAATDMCPLIELMMEASNGRTGPLLQTPWLDSITQLDLRAALASNQNLARRDAPLRVHAHDVRSTCRGR